MCQAALLRKGGNWNSVEQAVGVPVAQMAICPQTNSAQSITINFKNRRPPWQYAQNIQNHSIFHIGVLEMHCICCFRTLWKSFKTVSLERKQMSAQSRELWIKAGRWETRQVPIQSCVNHWAATTNSFNEQGLLYGDMVQENLKHYALVATSICKFANCKVTKQPYTKNF